MIFVIFVVRNSLALSAGLAAPSDHLFQAPGADRVLPCNLTGAALKGADLSGADLRQAVLAEADLSRANFTGALLRQVDATNAKRAGARGLEEVI